MMILTTLRTGSIMLMMTAVLLWSACGGSQQPQTETTAQSADSSMTSQPAAGGMGDAGKAASEPMATKQQPPSGQTAESRNKPAGNQLASRETPAPKERNIAVPAGTEIKGELETPLSSKTNKAGDIFRLIVTEPITLETMEVIPKGTVINGTVASVKPAERGSKKASMDLKFESITLISGRTLSIDAAMAVEGEEGQADASIEGESKKKRNAAVIAGGAAAGALAGKLLGKGAKETAIGAVAGGAAGTAAALAMKGGEVDLKEGSPLKLTLNNALNVPVKAGSGSNVAGK